MTLVADAALQDAAARIAVLPFESLGGNHGDAYFARGFVEDLIVELSRFPALEVVHPDSAIATTPADASVATFRLRGSVRRAGDVVRVTAQLVEVASGAQRWAERYDAPAARLSSLQDDIVARVASTLAIEIDSVRLARARRKPPSSLEAYDWWLRGIDALHGGTAEDDLRARGFFERALALDPSFARAHAGLSLSHFNEWSCQAWEVWDDKERLAYEHASRAAALDDGDAQVQMVLARVHVYRRDFDHGARLVERALALNPNDADVLAQASLARSYLGDPASGLALAEKAIRLHPRHPAWYCVSLAVALFALGRYAEVRDAVGVAPGAAVDVPAYLAASASLAGDAAAAASWRAVFEATFVEKITFGRAPEAGEPLRWIEQVNPYRDPAPLAALAQGLHAAGLMRDPDVVAAGVPSPPPRGDGERPRFRRDGDVWTMAFAGEVVRLSEVKGFADVALLLGRPGEDVHCLDLAGRQIETLGADAVFDERARRELRTRVSDLEEQVEAAERDGDFARAARAREELDQLVAALAGALGLGGRLRRVGSQVERARCTVTWRIKSAIRKVGQAHPALGRHLSNAVRTGTTCVYQPEQPVDWLL